MIVGAGLFGSVMARQLTDQGLRCLVLDRRNHIGGNCYTKNIDGINVHTYGAHIFHTSNEKIWNFVNRFAKFNHYVNRPKVRYQDKVYSFPLNLLTLNQLWGVQTPSEAKDMLEEKRIPIANPANLEEWILSQVGTEIYEIFIKGYTEKQWGIPAKNLPASIIKRLPIRLTFDDNYFNDCYQGIPIGGYTQIFTKLLDGIEVKTGIDYLESRDYFNSLAPKIIYTGEIDKFFDYSQGKLNYRSLKFETKIIESFDFQGNAVVNYTDSTVPFTRIIEHKHFEFGKQDYTIITHEYPQSYREGSIPYYPVNDTYNNQLYEKYKQLVLQDSRFIFGGRLAEYKYYDMHQVIGSALAKADLLMHKP